MAASESPYSIEQLVQAIAEPDSQHGVDRQAIRQSLGIGEYAEGDVDGMKAFARRKMEELFLQPVTNLSDNREQLGLWQL